MGRIANTAVFNQDEFDSLLEEQPDEDTKKNEVDNALSTIVDTTTMSILPSMLPQETDVYSLFFIPDVSYLEDEEFEALSMISTLYRVDIHGENAPGTSGDIQVMRSGTGRYLAVDNAMVLSAVEGIVPGYVVVSCTVDVDMNGKTVPKNVTNAWKVSHNWVEGLSSESAMDHLGDFMDIISSFTVDVTGEDDMDINIFATKDISIPEYPFLKPSPYSKDSVVIIVRSLEAVVKGDLDDEDEK